MKVKVGVSNNHIHLSKEDFKNLFGESEINSIKELSQEGEFVSDLKLDIKTDKSILKDVKVLGPLRDKTQVEISRTAAYKLGINPPVRMSGDLDNSESVELVSNYNHKLINNCCILANRHIHCKTSELEKYNLREGQVLSVKVEGIRPGILDNVIVKSKETFNFELHLDTDEANAFMLNNGDEVEIMEEK